MSRIISDDSAKELLNMALSKSFINEEQIQQIISINKESGQSIISVLFEKKF